jgi:NitT/TauT family transport system ATP-binding protein
MDAPASQGMKPDAKLLSVDIAAKSFAAANGDPVAVLKDLAFKLPAGRFTCMIGPSGCGKTTTLSILLGLDPNYAGSIDPAFARSRIGAVFQEPRLLPWRTVEENIRLALPDAMAGRDLSELFSQVGLAEFRNAFPAELSHGMARRAALARAFAIEPEILVLDEPFVSLDEATANRLRDRLASLIARRPATVLMVTHNIREAVRLADHLLILSDRPAHLVEAVDVELPPAARTGEPAEAFIRVLEDRHPGLVLL